MRTRGRRERAGFRPSRIRWEAGEDAHVVSGSPWSGLGGVEGERREWGSLGEKKSAARKKRKRKKKTSGMPTPWVQAVPVVSDEVDGC